MKVPAPPPDFEGLLTSIDPPDATRALAVLRLEGMQGEYLTWERARHKTPPAGLTLEQWWLGLKMVRLTVRRLVPDLLDTDGQPFHYTVPDELLQRLDEITAEASGSISIAEEVINAGTRDRYVISSLIEEAITSSQLEGASTSRRVAKDMLRTGRPPRTKSEQMIVNNYLAMQRVVELQGEPLTPDLVREIHAIVTDGTLDDPRDAGRLQTPDDGRVAVWGDGDQLLHRPPAADELPQRLTRLCDFANARGRGAQSYCPPVLRSIIVHFMVGYDHYFEDGNGRTARALFYWTMLNQGYWLTQFLTISTILKKAPAQYARSFLLTEQDDGDLTHFALYQTKVVLRAIDGLRSHLGNKMAEARSIRTRVAEMGSFNHRQVALLEHAGKVPHSSYTARSHARSHGVTEQTARTDLADLRDRGLLEQSLAGRQWVFTAIPGLAERLG